MIDILISGDQGSGKSKALETLTRFYFCIEPASAFYKDVKKALDNANVENSKVKGRKDVYLVIDGLTQDEIDTVYAPAILKLRNRGYYFSTITTMQL